MLCDWISFCHHFFAGEESRDLSHVMLHWKQQGPQHLKLGSTFESCSLKLLLAQWDVGRVARDRCIKADILVTCKSVGEGWWQ